MFLLHIIHSPTYDLPEVVLVILGFIQLFLVHTHRASVHW